MKKLISLLLLVFMTVFYIGFGQVEPIKAKKPLTRILFIFDASKSMLGEWDSDKKINIARQFLIETVDSLENVENLQMALRIYGHQSPVQPQDCNDTRLEVPFGSNTASRIRQELRYVKPRGTTPLAKSLGLSGQDFPDCHDCRNIVILITDGIEACNGDPCEISYELQKSGIILKPFIIGIGLDEGLTETFNCIGDYYNAADETGFREALEVIITQALNSTSAQVNLLDIYGSPTESDVNMSFYDLLSNKLRYNYMHTINPRGKPDTIQLDPLSSYRMVVHTLPPVSIDSIHLAQGKHTIIAADVPQGDLLVKTNGNAYRSMRFIVRKTNEMKTLNMQVFYEKEKYLVGYYDLEIPTLPPLFVDSVKISQSHTTKVEVPRPGSATFSTQSYGFGSLYYLEKDGSQRWIYNLKTDTRREMIDLLPGKYLVVYRPKEAPHTFYTITRRFTIYSGASKSIELH